MGVSPGDYVRRVFDVGRGQKLGDMLGVVVKVTPHRLAGGVKARVRVRWENGHEGTLDDRQLKVVAGPR